MPRAYVAVGSNLGDRERTLREAVDALRAEDGVKVVAVSSLIETEPGVVVEVFDEHDDRDVWQELEVPGSPYGVVLDPGGIVLAKGTFNSLAQLEGLLAFAERRRAGVAGV